MPAIAGVKKRERCITCDAPLLGRQMKYCNKACKLRHERGDGESYPNRRTEGGLHKRKITSGYTGSYTLVLPKECATHLHAFYGDYVSFENVAGGVMIRRVVE